MSDGETQRQFSYRLIIGQYCIETKIGELNRVLDKLDEQQSRITELTAENEELKKEFALMDRLNASRGQEIDLYIAEIRALRTALESTKTFLAEFYENNVVGRETVSVSAVAVLIGQTVKYIRDSLSTPSPASSAVEGLVKALEDILDAQKPEELGYGEIEVLARKALSDYRVTKGETK